MDKTPGGRTTTAILRNAIKDSTNLGCVERVDIKYPMLDVEAHTRTSVTTVIVALNKKSLLKKTISVVRTTKAGKPNSNSASAMPVIYVNDETEKTQKYPAFCSLLSRL